VTGVDVSPRQVALARQHVPEGEFVVGDATLVDFPGASFDAVVALFSFTHVSRVRHPALLADIARWLVPGGFLLACFGTVDVESWVEQDFLGLGGTSWTSSFDAPTNRRLLADAGFALDVAEVVETDETWGTERWFWVLAHTPGELA
jgi:ubiquinone/menaquinone biosynthesis C-methylase UbiE